MTSGTAGDPPAAAADGAWWRRRRVVLWALGLLVAAIAAVVVARLLRTTPAMQAFIVEYPGDAPTAADAPIGFPAWLAVQHGLNALFLLFTVRSGWRLHRQLRPSIFWTRRNTGPLRTRNAPIRIGIDLWSHYVADTLWVLNGALFLVLAQVTGQWLRIVPQGWGIVPAAVSTGVQYLSLDWPTTDGWIDYNGLQALSYFVVVYIAGPIAVLTGLRAAPGFAARLRPLDRFFSLRMSKRIHYWTMLFLVAFTAGHVFLVLATGALRNLNHMYALRDDQTVTGLLVFIGFMVAVVLVALAARPAVVRRAAARTGTVLERPARPRR